MSEPEKKNAGLRTLKVGAEFLGVSISQMYRLASAGQIDFVKVGSRGTRVTQDSLDRFIKSAKPMVPKPK
jgi:excisionase family DNA binding protein